MKPIDQLSEDEFAQLAQRAAALPDAPRDLVRAAIRQWHAMPAPTLQEAAAALLKRVVGVLTFDSWATGSMALGMRAVSSDVRHLLYSAQGRDIDVRIAPAADRFAITGQILGPDESGIVELAALADQGGVTAGEQSVALDALGEFRFDGISGGSVYALTLRLGEDEIVLSPIDVGERKR